MGSQSLPGGCSSLLGPNSSPNDVQQRLAAAGVNQYHWAPLCSSWKEVVGLLILSVRCCLYIESKNFFQDMFKEGSEHTALK